MYRLNLTCFACAALLSACHSDPGVELKTVDYQCEDGESLQVKYVIAASGPSMATLSYDNKLVPMHQERAASGVLYVADKDQPGYRWHTKGRDGMLLLQKMGEEEMQTLLGHCSSAPTP
ncbi:MliC family protein [Microbulbifer sp. SAOS-129_SWC]|uniref:MliC family protein n=1 Tax=Microbulbifer sp. SAOS-129_SWC TaxID=3145235 RepID=UPI003216CF38